MRNLAVFVTVALLAAACGGYTSGGDDAPAAESQPSGQAVTPQVPDAPQDDLAQPPDAAADPDAAQTSADSSVADPALTSDEMLDERVVAALSASGAAAEESRCVAAALKDTLGTERYEAAFTGVAISDTPAASQAGLDETEKTAMAAAAAQCSPFGAIFNDMNVYARSGDSDGQAAACWDALIESQPPAAASAAIVLYGDSPQARAFTVAAGECVRMLIGPDLDMQLDALGVSAVAASCLADQMSNHETVTAMALYRGPEPLGEVDRLLQIRMGLCLSHDELHLVGSAH